MDHYNQRDYLARCAYSSDLTEAAEGFLLEVFRGSLSLVEDLEPAVSAAMTIVCGVCWVQPTEGQLQLGTLLDDEDDEVTEDAAK